MRTFSLILFSALMCFAGKIVSAQTADRTIDEIKIETLARAQTGAYPALGIQPIDASDALGRIHTRDPDEWAAAWSAVADSYMAKAKAASDPKEADANFVRVWRLYYFGQWPAPTSAGKQAAYQRAIDAYLQHARYFDPPLEVVRIPFEGKEIVGYLRLPANAKRAVPLVLAISGLDSRKETVAETDAVALAEGIAFFAVDSPGTGQAPRKADQTSDQMYSRVLDYLTTRPEIDKNRILVHGQSFGAYWAAKLAHTEAKRLAGAVTQSPPIHRTRSSRTSSAAGCTPRISVRPASSEPVRVRPEIGRRVDRLPAEDVPAGAEPARQADSADSRGGRHAGHPGAHR
ncbi:MAG: alpha/beta hydrolase [Bradyrhizobium sp.]